MPCSSFVGGGSHGCPTASAHRHARACPQGRSSPLAVRARHLAYLELTFVAWGVVGHDQHVGSLGRSPQPACRPCSGRCAGRARAHPSVTEMSVGTAAPSAVSNSALAGRRRRPAAPSPTPGRVPKRPVCEVEVERPDGGQAVEPDSPALQGALLPPLRTRLSSSKVVSTSASLCESASARYLLSLGTAEFRHPHDPSSGGMCIGTKTGLEGSLRRTRFKCRALETMLGMSPRTSTTSVRAHQEHQPPLKAQLGHRADAASPTLLSPSLIVERACHTSEDHEDPRALGS